MSAWSKLISSELQIDKAFEHLFTKWQRNMFRLNKSLIGIAIAIEVAAAFGGAAERFETLGVTGYALQCVLLPFSINVLMTFSPTSTCDNWRPLKRIVILTLSPPSKNLIACLNFVSKSCIPIVGDN